MEEKMSAPVKKITLDTNTYHNDVGVKSPYS